MVCYISSVHCFTKIDMSSLVLVPTWIRILLGLYFIEAATRNEKQAETIASLVSLH